MISGPVFEEKEEVWWEVADQLSVWKLDSTQEPIIPVAEPATSMHSCHGVFTDQFIFKNREFEICQVSQASQKNLHTWKCFFWPYNDV